jgi:peroxiredoxin
MPAEEVVMGKLLKYRVLIVGLLSPLAVVLLGTLVYSTLTRASVDKDRDFVFRLSMTTLAMLVPFAVTAALAAADRRRHALTTSAKVGLGIAILSLAPAYLPIRGGIERTRQARNLSQQNVPAPAFDTVDVLGNPHRLDDHAGKVVLLNVWATWCAPCKQEMPSLDRLYQARKEQGFMVFGLSTESLDVQREFVQKELSVSYPLLTVNGKVPEMYRAVQRFPATFLIDRAGRLQRAPGPDEPFERMEAAVDTLLQAPRPGQQ